MNSRWKLVAVSHLAADITRKHYGAPELVLQTAIRIGRNVAGLDALVLPPQLTQFSGQHCCIYPDLSQVRNTDTCSSLLCAGQAVCASTLLRNQRVSGSANPSTQMACSPSRAHQLQPLSLQTSQVAQQRSPHSSQLPARCSALGLQGTVQWLVEDTSTNGTFIDGERITRNTSARLPENSRLRLSSPPQDVVE